MKLPPKRSSRLRTEVRFSEEITTCVCGADVASGCVTKSGEWEQLYLKRLKVARKSERLLTDLWKRLAASLDVCPTGALMDKLPQWRAEVKAKEENLCPEISDIVMSLYDRYRERESKASICPYCGVGCRLIFEVQDGEIVRTVPDPNGPANKGLSCVKGRFGIGEFVHSPDRLKTPLIRKNGSLEETSWEEALDAVAKQFSKYNPDEVAVISSAKCTNEENYVIQKFARVVLKTNSVDHCARL